MNATNPEATSGKVDQDPATQEKIREFCRELALIVRRLSGHVVEGDIAELAEETDETSQQNIDETIN